MMEAYASGDPYMAFAKQAGAAPADATRETHSSQRERFKQCALAVQYGMGEQTLGQILGRQTAFARELLALHRSTYRRFWKWVQGVVDFGSLQGYLETVFGWQVHTLNNQPGGTRLNSRSLANFPMQANGAEMLRLACCLAKEREIEVCAPVHDALLVEADEAEIDDVILATQRSMAEASQTVLESMSLRSEAKKVISPDRYMDPRGARMWQTVQSLIYDENAFPGLFAERSRSIRTGAT